MKLAIIDWIIIVIYLSISLYIGLKYKAKAQKSLTDYFLGGRNLPWYIAGISMVATTFAADTPLWVTERVAQHGISGNWLWWNMLIGGMLTTFFFARLWRRANILTELEFIEFRYSGKPAAFLRGFKSVYMGIFLNAIIIGWVNIALITIIHVFFDIPEKQVLWIVAGAMVLVAFYSTLSGLIGVVITDTIQFCIAMAGCIILAVIVLYSEKVGGISGLKEQLPEWRFNFFPSIGKESTPYEIIGTFSVTVGAFLTFGLVQWWASWYPGAEPGGGGYIAQRIMSTKNEKHSVYATLFFQIAHYCIRPWPWIIVGLCALILYPDLAIDEAGKGFVFAMRDYLPAGLKGLLLVAFLAAYMSTISTQLNWGASYLTNDLYKRFIKPENKYKNTKDAQKDYIQKARIFTVLIMLFSFFATTQIKTIDSAVRFLIECGAGLGLVLILRWYWWRINAWSEIVASIAPFVGYTFSVYVFNLKFPDSFLLTVGFSTVSWLIVTYLTPQTDEKTLLKFYERVKPQGIWKKAFLKIKIKTQKKQLANLFISWISSIIMVYSILFFLGKLIFQEWNAAAIWGAIAICSFFILRNSLKNEA